MPYKHSESRRHKFTKPRYKVTNWPEYNDSLRRRGDFTIWFTQAAIDEWRPARTGARGRPREYSAHAICIPDFSSSSRRSIELPRHTLSKALQPGSLVIVDSTGLKVYGKGEWHQEKHDVPARRTWRKLHLAVDEKHQILACELTIPEVGVPPQFQICSIKLTRRLRPSWETVHSMEKRHLKPSWPSKRTQELSCLLTRRPYAPAREIPKATGTFETS